MSKIDIGTLAREYAKEYSPKEYIDPILREKAVELNSNIFADFLQYLSKDYCIVSKELIRKEYEEAKSTHDLYMSATCINEMESRAIDHAEGRMCELTTLFGKSLFNEGKE